MTILLLLNRPVALFASDAGSVSASGGEGLLVAVSSVDAMNVSDLEIPGRTFYDTDAGATAVAEAATQVTSITSNDTGNTVAAEVITGFVPSLQTQNEAAHVTALDIATVYATGYSAVDSGVTQVSESASWVLVMTDADPGSSVFITETAAILSIKTYVSESGMTAVMYPSDSQIDDFISGRSGVIQETFRMYKVDRNGLRTADITDSVSGAKIAGDRTNVIARTGSFSVKNLKGLNLASSFDVSALVNLSTTTDFFQPTYVLGVNELEVEFVQGIFLGTVPQRSDGERQADASVNLSDLSVLLSVDFPYPFTVPGGSNAVEAIKSIANLALIQNFNITPTALVTPNDFTFSPGTTLISAINGIAQGINYIPVFFDKPGRLTSRPRAFARDRAPDVTYGSSTGTQIVKPDTPFQSQSPLSHLPNEVIVQVNDPLRGAFSSTYYIENPASPVVLPVKYAMSGFSQTSFLLGNSPSTPVKNVLNPANMAAALPSFPVDGFPVPGAVSIAGWFYLDTTLAVDTVIGGMWGSASNKTFLLMSATAPNAGVTGPCFKVSQDGSSEVYAQVPMPPVSGWYHLVGVFNPGGSISANLMQNGGFEVGLTSPSSWTAQSVGTQTTSLSFDTTAPPEGVRSLVVTFSPTAANSESQMRQDISSGFTIGRPVTLGLSHFFLSRSNTQFTVGVTVNAYDKNNVLLASVLNTQFTTLDASAGNFSDISSPVPTGTAYLSVLLRSYGGTSSSGSSAVKWDNITLMAAVSGELSLTMNGAGIALTRGVTASILPTTLHTAGTAVMQLGATPYGGNPFPGMMTGVALYYGGITPFDAASLYAGMWPTNVPFCLAYWHMDAATQQPLNDQASRGFALYPQGSLNYRVVSGLGSDRFKAVPDTLNFPYIIDQANADLAAQIFAEDDASKYFNATFSSGIDPRREINEVYQVTLVDADGNLITDAKYIVDGFDFDLSVGGTMNHKIRRVEAF